MGKKQTENTVLLHYKANPDFCFIKPVHEEQLWTETASPDVRPACNGPQTQKVSVRYVSPKLRFRTQRHWPAFLRKLLSPRHIYILLLLGIYMSGLYSQPQSHFSNGYPALQPLPKDLTATAPKYGKCLHIGYWWGDVTSVSTHTPISFRESGTLPTPPHQGWECHQESGSQRAPALSQYSQGPQTAYHNIPGYSDYMHLQLLIFPSVYVSFVILVSELYPQKGPEANMSPVAVTNIIW